MLGVPSVHGPIWVLGRLLSLAYIGALDHRPGRLAVVLPVVLREPSWFPPPAKGVVGEPLQAWPWWEQAELRLLPIGLAPRAPGLMASPQEAAAQGLCLLPRGPAPPCCLGPRLMAQRTATLCFPGRRCHGARLSLGTPSSAVTRVVRAPLTGTTAGAGPAQQAHQLHAARSQPPGPIASPGPSPSWVQNSSGPVMQRGCAVLPQGPARPQPAMEALTSHRDIRGLPSTGRSACSSRFCSLCHRVSCPLNAGESAPPPTPTSRRTQ